MRIEITDEDITPYLTINNNEFKIFYDKQFIVRDISWNRYKHIYEYYYKTIIINGKRAKDKESFEKLLLDIMERYGYIYVNNDEEEGFELKDKQKNIEYKERILRMY